MVPIPHFLQRITGVSFPIIVPSLSIDTHAGCAYGSQSQRHVVETILHHAPVPGSTLLFATSQYPSSPRDTVPTHRERRARRSDLVSRLEDARGRSQGLSGRRRTYELSTTIAQRSNTGPQRLVT